MKRIFILCCAICFSAHASGQDTTSVRTEKRVIVMEYDGAGNRTARKTVQTATANSSDIQKAPMKKEEDSV